MLEATYVPQGSQTGGLVPRLAAAPPASPADVNSSLAQSLNPRRDSYPGFCLFFFKLSMIYLSAYYEGS